MGNCNGAPADRPLDVELVARLVRTAGLDCQADAADGTGVLIRAGRGHRHPGARPPGRSVQRRWTSRLFVDPTGELCVGPDDSDTLAVRVAGREERTVAALVIAQALVRDPGRPLSPDEIGALGLVC